MVTADVELGKHQAFGDLAPPAQPEATQLLANGETNSIERHIVGVEHTLATGSLQKFEADAHQQQQKQHPPERAPLNDSTEIHAQYTVRNDVLYFIKMRHRHGWPTGCQAAVNHQRYEAGAAKPPQQREA